MFTQKKPDGIMTNDLHFTIENTLCSKGTQPQAIHVFSDGISTFLKYVFIFIGKKDLQREEGAT